MAGGTAALSEAGFAGLGGIFGIVGDGAGAVQRILFTAVRRAVRWRENSSGCTLPNRRAPPGVLLRLGLTRWVYPLLSLLDPRMRLRLRRWPLRRSGIRHAELSGGRVPSPSLGGIYWDLSFSSPSHAPSIGGKLHSTSYCLLQRFPAQRRSRGLCHLICVQRSLIWREEVTPLI